MNQIANFNSKKLAAFSAVVASVMTIDTAPDVKTIALVVCLALYQISQAFVDRKKDPK